VELDTADMTRTGTDRPYARPKSALTAGSLTPSARRSADARTAAGLTNTNTEA